MEKWKRVFSTKNALCLALALLIVSVLLVGGVTYARYQWDFLQVSYFFAPENKAAVTVYTQHLSQQMIDSGTLPGAPGEWVLTDRTATLRFSVANGNLQETVQQNQTFVVRIAAGLTVGSPEKLSVVLSYTDAEGNPVSVPGQPKRIVPGSFQHDTFGDGWVYHFPSAGNELRFDLTGGSFDYRNFTVTVTGDVPATLLNLQVTQNPAN